MKEINLLSLFSGIGAFEKALNKLGVKYNLVNYCEIDKYASKAYSMVHKCSEDKNLGDITKIDTTALPNDIDLITYGFPCQDISLAGKQKGFEADGERTRSGLFFEALRIIEDTKPRIAIAENVKNLTSKKFSKEFDIVLSSLEEAGYNNYWKVLNAKDFGIPQNRERVFIVSIRKDLDNGMFKFPDGFELQLRLKDMLEDEVDEKYYLSDKMLEYISANNEKWTGNNDKSLVNKSIASTLNTGEGHRRCDASNYIVPSLNDDDIDLKVIREYRQPCIEIKEATKKGFKEAYDGDGIYLNRPHQKRGVVQHGMIQTLKTSGNDVGVVVSEPEIIRVGKTKSGGQRSEIISGEGISSCLSATDYKQQKQIENNLRIRKLTPLECFRLMGFDDEDFNKITGISNTQLYKQAGNSIVVDVLANLFREVFIAVDFEIKNNVVAYEQTVLDDYIKEEVKDTPVVVTVKEASVSSKNMILWEDLDTLVGKPLYDGNIKQWRILSEYRRNKEGYYVGFTDTNKLVKLDINNTHLYKNEIA